jgi:SAM-dependent methyltransferase
MKLLERIGARKEADLLKGHIDAISRAEVRGWAFEPGRTAPITVRVTLDGQLLAEGVSDLPRPDVEKAFGVFGCGFKFSSDKLASIQQEQLDNVVVEAVSSDGRRLSLPKGRDVKQQAVKQQATPQQAAKTTYQSFDGRPGASDSQGKLRAIQLPKLAGKSFLDLGCNAGFFCEHALKSGATRVVGIEANPGFAEEAQRICPEATILNQSWSRLPDEKFDVIIMLSALHYENNPAELLKRLHDLLTPDGVFILEYGVEMADVPYWIEVPRSVGVVKYPTSALLINYLLKDFAVRCVGRSVDQAGDQLPRYVYHCRKKRPNWIAVTGEAGIGKSNLGYSLKREGVVTLQTDQLFFRQSLSKIKLSDRDLDTYMRKLKPSDIRGWVNDINSSDLAGKVAKFLFNSIPTECEVVVIEGYVFTNNLVYTELTNICKKNNIRIWRTELAN